MSQTFYWTILLALSVGSSTGCATHRPPAIAQNETATPLFAEHARNLSAAIDRLQAFYNPKTGLYETTGWWNSANAITVLIDYARVGRTKRYDAAIANTFAVAPKRFPNFLNDYYDDEGWWALAWIDACDLTHSADYLAMAKTIFADMADGWDDTCHGGSWWSKERNYKNAIANELFPSVAAHLGNRTHGAERNFYKTWSEKEWAWFLQSGMINSDGLINDGLSR